MLLKKGFILIFAFPALSIACHKPKNNPQLPVISTTGANTMGCTVNGVLWLPNKDPSWRYPPYALVSKGNGVYEVDFSSAIDNTGVSLYLTEIYNAGTYKLYNPHIDKFGILTTSGGFYITDSTNYETDSINTGTVTILRVDTFNHILSGTFSYKALQYLPKKANINKMVTIADGRFDLKD